VTIFFADIVGSTEKAEKLDPEEWREVVAGAHQRVGEAVGRYEGTVAQLLGDGVLAFFGAPVTHEDDPERAVRTALDLQKAIEEYAAELAGYVDDFGMRVGIHAGMVVVGEIGSEERSEYLAVGDAVNVAARLEGAAEPGQIVVSEQIARRVRAYFDLTDLGPMELKGKSDPLSVYAVVGEKDVPARERGLEGARRVFVGRQRELDDLRQAVLDLCRGHGQIRFILGEAGIGKSRLVEELRERPPEPPPSEALLVDPRKVHWLGGRAVSYGGSLPYRLVIQLILADLGVSEGAPAPRLRTALRKRAEEILGERAAEFRPYLSRLVGLKLDPSEVERISQYNSETLGREIRRSILAYFEALARQRPVVLVLEDLHWVDASSLEVLAELLPVTNRAPLMILGVMRVERDHGSWDLKQRAERDLGHRYGEVTLRPLPGDAAEQLLAGVLGEVAAWGGVADLVLSKAEGNPFYLEELLRHLIERDLIVKENGRWKATAELEGVEVPDTLQGVLLARIDRLEQNVQETLQLASVIGRSFLYRILGAILDAEEELDRHLDELQKVDLVREKSRLPELEYIFKHSLTQEATYSSLLVERRKLFHQRVAQAIEMLFGDRLEEFYGLLAHHCELSGEIEAAIDYLTKAADQATLEDSLEEAKEILRRLQNLIAGSGDREMEAKVWMKLALMHQADFEFDEAHDAYESAFQVTMKRLRDASQIGGSHPNNELAQQELREPLNPNVFSSLNLTNASSVLDANILRNVMAGLAYLDEDLNVIPHAARSWEVASEGLTYKFHLRDDMRWSDGRPLVSEAFTAYWIWQLKHKGSEAGLWLDVVKGAAEFRAGLMDDPAKVGLRVLSERSFEVELKEPSPHFLYLIAEFGYPAYVSLLEEYGADWWRPPHGQYSGPFRIVEMGDEGMLLLRNPYYPGECLGNVGKVRFITYEGPRYVAEAYQGNEIDFCGQRAMEEMGAQVPEDEIQMGPLPFFTEYILLDPTQSPTDDLDVRLALARSVDRRIRPSRFGDNRRPALGGIVPPGMPGHSPEIGISTDVQAAKDLMRQVKRAQVRKIEPLIVAHFPEWIMPESYLQNWSGQLGLQVEFRPFAPGDDVSRLAPHVYGAGWFADFPDPYSFLVHMLRTQYSWLGWSDPAIDEFHSQLRSTRNRRARLDAFRRIDRYLVREQVLLIPIYYDGPSPQLVKPWIQNYRTSRLGTLDFKDVIVSRA
jgi:class 3 adenylate cyclase/ABC-type oligopeptide transport system substrate-binding subunit